MPQVLHNLESNMKPLTGTLAALKIPSVVKQDIETATSILLEKFDKNINKIILFGSYATGRYQTDSDVDIMISLNELPLLRDRRKYMQATDTIDREIDLLFCTNEQLLSSAYIFKQINEQGITLYEQL